MADKKTTPLDLPTLSSAPAAPGAGYMRFYGKTDGKPYAKSDAGTEYDLSAVGATYTHPNHTGDVTSAGDGATTIANNAVTNAKAADMATKTYKGRTAAGTGDPEDVPVATLKTDLALTKADVGLSNVDNTSDANKPVSSATQTALNAKENTFSKGSLVAGTNVTLSGTIANRLVGSGDVTINATDGGGGWSGILSIKSQTGTAYTLVLTDVNTLVRCNNAAAITLTIPTNASVAFAVGTVIYVEQTGAGTVTVAPASGVTINPSGRKTPFQNGIITLVQVAANVWNVIGGTV